MLGGYVGKILWVNLSTGETRDEALEEKLCRDFIGGYGIGARIIFSRQKPGVDPLGPDNILGFITGPLTGSPAPTGSRYTVVGKSPLTGSWGDANSGGDFGPNLKFAGYDAVFFVGISEKPVYLYIEDGRPELRDASHLWGKDSFETEDILKGELGNRARTCCIGPAGEKLSLISGIMNNKGRTAARSGLGAVMGSKKLKAIAVIGRNQIPIADKDKVSQLRKKYLAQLAENQLAKVLREFGTSAFTAPLAVCGRTPVKNWGGIGEKDFPEPGPIDGDSVIARLERKWGCWRCPVACGGHMKEGTEYEYEAGAHKPEYETLGAFGTMCLNNNLESIIKANDICNRYGLDTMSTGSTIAAAIEWYQNGIISSKDTEGIELKWGNHRAIVAMVEKMAKREGFGDVLADGVKKAAEKIGRGAQEYAIHIGGQELPMLDPRFTPSYVVLYKLDATPGRHTRGGYQYYEAGMTIPGLDLPILEKYTYHGKGMAHKILNTQDHVNSASGVCLFLNMSIGILPVLEFLNAVMGQSYTLDDLLKIGERICNLRHAFNLREGINPLELKVPERALGRPAQPEGPLAGVTIDQEPLIKDYLEAMDWDPVTCRPSDKKLRELGLEDVISQLPTT